MKKNTERFSDRVANYVRYRPHYPAEIISFLKEKIQLLPNWVIADIGSGTGISSEPFLQNGNTVFAIEPNKEMREAAETEFKNHQRFISVKGTAEDTHLDENSVDLILAGQAFHWFDLEKSKIEFQRIARSEAYLVLMWNERKLESNFQQGYEQLLYEFTSDYDQNNIRNIDLEKIKKIYSPHAFIMETFQNVQSFSYEDLKGRLLSSSYIPLEDDPTHLPMMNKLQQLFQKYHRNGRIDFAYDCKLYVGKIKK